MKRYFDFGFVLLLLIFSNMIIHFLGSDDVKVLSFHKTKREIKQEHSNSKQKIIILGDSRSMRLDKNVLADELGIVSREIINASVISGSWYSSYALLNYLRQNGSEAKHALLCVSEYWLERPDFENSSGVYPLSSSYFDISLEDFLISYTPISSKRGRIVNRIRSYEKGLMSKIFTDQKLKSEQNLTYKFGQSNLAYCNVDLWFSKISDEEIERNLSYGRKVLREVLRIQPSVTLVYLPNANAREMYVEKNFPGRKSRFMSNIKILAEEFFLDFINLSGSIESNDFYEDFHHWNVIGSRKGSKILAREILNLKRILPKNNSY